VVGHQVVVGFEPGDQRSGVQADSQVLLGAEIRGNQRDYERQNQESAPGGLK